MIGFTEEQFNELNGITLCVHLHLNAFNVSAEHKQIYDEINRPLRLGLIEFQYKLYCVAKFNSKNVICGVANWIISSENQEQINGILIYQNSFNQHFVWQNYDRQNLHASLN